MKVPVHMTSGQSAKQRAGSRRLPQAEADSQDLLGAESLLQDLSAAFFQDRGRRGDAAVERRQAADSDSPHTDQLYRALVEQIPAVVFMAYLDRRISEAFVSPHIEAALGFSQAEWLEDPVRWYYRLHPDDRERWNLEAAETFLTGKPLRSTYRVLARDGHVVWFRCEARMVRREDGEPWFIHGVAFDITELKHAEEELQKSHQKLEARVRERTAALQIEVDHRKRSELALAQRLEQLRSIYETANAASRASSLEDIFQAGIDGLKAALNADRASILLIDADGVMRFQASRGLSSEYREAVEGHSPWPASTRFPAPILIPSLEEDVTIGALRAVIMEEGIRAIGFIPLIGEDRLLGKFMVYYDAPHAFTDDELHIAQTIASHVAFAIERELAEKQRADLLRREEEARAEAERSSRLKDEFLAAISHELRTPLTAILGWARMLRSGELNEQDRDRALKVVERNAKAQAQLIEDLLDVSRIITGKLRLKIRSVDLVSVLEAATESLRFAAEAKQIHLETAIDEQVTYPFLGDAERLQQVIWNLLSNAIKFTPERGRVRVALGVSDACVEISVSDTGQGIRTEFLPHAFERFRQADSSSTRLQGGLGIGLAIVRHLVELHGGTVWAESAGLGQGATFTVRLPLVTAPFPAPPAPQTEKNTRPIRLHHSRLLVVDDDPDSREVIASVLRHSGSQVLAVSSASEALKELETFHPDLLITDIAMPEVDGYALIRKVRESEFSSGSRALPAIALTAHAAHDDCRKVLESGFQLHVAKPIEPAELVVAVAGLLGRAHDPSDI